MKKLFITIATFATLMSITLTTKLHAETGDWYIAPSLAYLKSDQSRANSDDSGSNIEISVGREFTDRINLELDLGLNRIDILESSRHYDQFNLGLDALFFLNRKSNFSPYLATGLGIIETDETDDTNANWSAGLGLLSDLGIMESAKLRTEIRFQQEYDSSEFVHDDILYRVGIQIPIGETASPAPAKPMPLEPMVKDTDGDGVNDDSDKCPATPVGTVVNSFGCEVDGDSDRDGVADSKDQCPNTPFGTAVDDNGCKVDGDSDNDGVKDSADQCPNTVPGTSVDSVGCPGDPDSDNDGVPNSKDQCPNTTAGVRVDFKGCEIRDVISLPGINFETNSSNLTASSTATLDGAASTLIKYPDITAEVAGHTDSTGAAAYNLSLSDKRAAAVRTYLVNKGVAASRLTSKGYGETQPIADNGTESGRSVNRRVDLNVAK